VRICITGGLGHCGSFIVPYFQQNGDSVTILDNLSTQRYASLYGLDEHNPVRFIEGDILDYDLSGLFHGADVVICLAAITDAPSTVAKPAETWRVNYEGTQRVVDACTLNGCRLVFLSTTSVYGVSNGGMVDELTVDLKPQSPYAEAKLSAERYVLFENQNATVLRCGTVYGVSVGMRWHTFVNRAVWQAALGQPITVWRTAMDQLRPYLYLGDLLSAIVHVLDNNLTGLYCTLTDNHAPRDIIKVLKHYRPDLTVTLTDDKIMNLYSYCVSNQKLISTGWQPKGGLETGIAQTLTLLGGVRGKET